MTTIRITVDGRQFDVVFPASLTGAYIKSLVGADVSRSLWIEDFAHYQNDQLVADTDIVTLPQSRVFYTLPPSSLDLSLAKHYAADIVADPKQEKP
jgi:hypothetical protein